MRRILLTLALVSAIGVAVAKPTAEIGTPVLAATADQTQAAIWATRFLSKYHYKPVPLDDAMSEKIFDRYLDSLDSEHLFFTQADIDQFSGMRNKLDDAIFDRDLSTPFAIFALYLKRVGERLAYSREVLSQVPDFSLDESYRYDRAKAPWAKTTAELDDLWRKRVKNDWLRLKLAGKAEKDIRSTLDKRYSNYLDRVRQLNGEDVFQTFMNAYATSIEPHTNYLGPRASANFDIAMKLSLEGIGAVLQRQEEYTAIREIIPGGPAALSGVLKAGDRVVGVAQGDKGEMIDVIGWRLDDVVEKIRGAKGTVVRLEILPAAAGLDGKHETLILVRNKVNVEEQAAKKSIIEVKDKVIAEGQAANKSIIQGEDEIIAEGEAVKKSIIQIDGEGTTYRIGVISLPTFYQDFEARRKGDANYRSATRDVETLLIELKREKVDGVVVDLRNNGGGSLAEATDLTGLFIDTGPVVQVRNASGRVEQESDRRPGSAWEGPLAVMINRASASASEIFAAAIQDYGRGLIIGEPSFGKGTVQNLISMDDMAGNEKATYGDLKMTIAQFFRINGGSTQLRGVTPDISFPLTLDAGEFGESSYDNALPWTSIAPAKYQPVADLQPVMATLQQRHAARVADNQEWKDLEADIAEARKVRAEKTISLNEVVRKTERDAQEAKRKAREARREASESTAPAASGNAVDGDVEDEVSPISRDDGLQADERSIQADLAREKERKERPDVALDEAAHILADEIQLIRAEPKLAAQVLPPQLLKEAPRVD